MPRSEWPRCLLLILYIQLSTSFVIQPLLEQDIEDAEQVFDQERYMPTQKDIAQTGDKLFPNYKDEKTFNNSFSTLVSEVIENNHVKKHVSRRSPDGTSPSEGSDGRSHVEESQFPADNQTSEAQNIRNMVDGHISEGSGDENKITKAANFSPQLQMLHQDIGDNPDSEASSPDIRQSESQNHHEQSGDAETNEDSANLSHHGPITDSQSSLNHHVENQDSERSPDEHDTESQNQRGHSGDAENVESASDSANTHHGKNQDSDISPVEHENKSQNHHEQSGDSESAESNEDSANLSHHGPIADSESSLNHHDNTLQRTPFDFVDTEGSGLEYPLPSLPIAETLHQERPDRDENRDSERSTGEHHSESQNQRGHSGDAENVESGGDSANTHHGKNQDSDISPVEHENKSQNHHEQSGDSESAERNDHSETLDASSENFFNEGSGNEDHHQST